MSSYDGITQISAVISRREFDTETTGELELIVDCALQGYEYLSNETRLQLKYGAIMNRIGIRSSIHWNILKVLYEFEEAKKSFEEVRNKAIELKTIKKP